MKAKLNPLKTLPALISRAALAYAAWADHLLGIAPGAADESGDAA